MSQQGATPPVVVDGDGLIFWCPGCDGAHRIQHGAGPRPRWSWNGSLDKPTFSPSVLVRGYTWTPPVPPENLDEWRRKPWEQHKVETVCHSFVTDGRIQFLGDCTHALAGQTVDLPGWDGDG